MNENFEYLDQIATRASLHKKTLDQTKEFLIKHKIKDANIIRDALILGQVWASDLLGKPITHNDILMYLGTEEPPVADYNEIVLDEKHKNKTLHEILRLVIKRKF
jgi:hypothetical protein